MTDTDTQAAPNRAERRKRGSGLKGKLKNETAIPPGAGEGAEQPRFPSRAITYVTLYLETKDGDATFEGQMVEDMAGITHPNQINGIVQQVMAGNENISKCTVLDWKVLHV